MEIKSAAHFLPSQSSSASLDKIITLNGQVEGLEFRLPIDDKCTNSVSMPWVFFFENHIEVGLRFPPPSFFLSLAKNYGVPLCQFNLFSLHRAAALHILCTFYLITDSVGLIHTTHPLKRAPPLYCLSSRPGNNISFVSHKSIDRGYQQYYLCVQPVPESANWHYAGGRSHSVYTLNTTRCRPLSSEEILLLEDLSSFYVGKGSFPLISLTENPNALAVCGLFPSFQTQ